MNKLSESRAWLEAMEESRLQGNVQRPNTSWVFERAVSVELKAILSRHPLQIGHERLPDWLRRKCEVISLDQYEDYLCLFRCLAIHEASRPDRCARRTRQLAQSFFAAHPNLRPPPPVNMGNRVVQSPIAVDKLYWVEKHFQQGIAAYTVTSAGDFVLTHTPAHYDQIGRPTMTIGIYEEHAFFIKDMNKVTNNYECGDCGARFTQSNNLSRHAKTCSRGQTKFDCPGNRILAPESVFEKAFYPKSSFGFKAVCWLEYEAKQRGIHIHHQRCGHGGERTIFGCKVDGYHPESQTIFQYHGCHWHGCPDCFPEDEERDHVISKPRNGREITREDAYQATLRKTDFLRRNGYTVIERWEHELPRPWWNDRCLPKGNKTYPHAIAYDFEAYQDKTKASQPTRDLSYESEHVPISVSIADTLNPEPEYIVSRESNELLRLFYHALERRSDAIREDIAQKYRPPDVEGFAEAQKRLIDQWCDQVPVLGFNSGHYDLKLIRKYFVTQLAQENGVLAAEKEGRIMFIKTPRYNFLDIMNYMSPGTTYDKWVKTYGAKQTKSWLPYEWFDSPDKLDYPGLPPYWCWYSQLKNAFVLSPAEYEECQRVFRERGMQVFGDWLEYYNNLDVSPFLEALVKMRDFYTALGIDIFKDAVSLPGVSMQYILRGTLSGSNAPVLYAPGPEAYAMLKGAVVGGPSLVFTRKHVAGQTRIRSHKHEETRVTKRILGFDANSLYPSTMLHDMPCGQGRVVHYEAPWQAAQELPFKLVTGQWFGFAEVDIEVPRDLWEKFEEFPPFFINQAVPDEGVPQHMEDYLQDSGRTRFPDQKKLLGVLSAKKMLIYAPLLKWYLNRGLKITAVYRTINYTPQKLFNWFVQEVSNNRRAGDEDKEKALLAEVFKLLGNSAYGKFIEAVERQTRTIYTKDEAEVDKHLRSAWFEDLDVIGDTYKIECRKAKVQINRLFQGGILVYQLAKLRMLEFYYDFLDYFLDRRDFELIQMDTDSMYFALAHNKLEEAIKPELRKDFEQEKNEGLSWDKWSNREPGLFKLEKEGTRAIALCSKCYFVEDEAGGQAKMSS